MKVIHFYPALLYPPTVNPLRLGEWHMRTARELGKRHPQYEVECWTLVDHAQFGEPWISSEGHVTYRFIPSYPAAARLPFSRGYSPFCPQFIESLRQISPSEMCILHIHGDSGFPAWLSLLFKKSNVHIVMQDHGSTLLRRNRLPRMLERRLLRRADHIFVMTKKKADFLTDKLGLDASKVTNRWNGAGVDFKSFSPRNKSQARRELRLPIDKPVLLYVGRTINEKGLPLILSFWKQLRANHDVELVVAGARAGSELYDRVKREVRFVFDYVNDDAYTSEMLPTLYNAASIFIQFWQEPVLAVAGIGTATIEALACNIPIISNSLTNAPLEIQSSLGAIPHRPEDLYACFEKALEMTTKFRGRDIAERYWSWDVMIEDCVEVYKEITQSKR